MTEFDLELTGGQNLHVYDTGVGDDPQLVVFWHHGTPNIGSPPAPLFGAAERLAIRWVSFDRPGYGGSTPVADRDIASAAGYVSRIADHLRIDEFATMGHSGGGPHALACGALLPARVLAVVSGAGMAPYGATGLDWFGGMAASGVRSLRAAVQGRAAKQRLEASGVGYDPEFTPADLAALEGEWSWLVSVVGPAVESGPGGLIDDDLAYVSPWGFQPKQVVAPTLLLHGCQDRVIPSAHGEWLSQNCSSAELRLFPDDGHISVLRHGEAALEWLREQVPRERHLG